MTDQSESLPFDPPETGRLRHSLNGLTSDIQSPAHHRHNTIETREKCAYKYLGGHIKYLGGITLTLGGDNPNHRIV